MSREVLLLEPPYKNKYPPMGLMKLATYFRNRGDNVRFFKGDLRNLAAELLCDEFLVEVQGTLLVRERPKLIEHIKTGKFAPLEAIRDFRGSELDAIIARYRRRFIAEDYPRFDIIGVTTLFTFYWTQTIKTINEAKKFLRPKPSKSRLLIGGIASTILYDRMVEAVGDDARVTVFKGLLRAGDIDAKDTQTIDELPLDYSILDETDYIYPASNAYFGYMTRGCPNKCAFCAVPRLEPTYCNYIGIQSQLQAIADRYGERKDLLLMDNNVFASTCFNQIVDEIKACGFGRGAMYSPPIEYDIALKNLSLPEKKRWNTRAFVIKMIKIYDEIASKLIDETEQGDFRLAREKAGLLYPTFATAESIKAFDNVVRPFIERFYKKTTRIRFVDFNQGVDARLVTDANMEKLSEVAIRPLRIAFDHYELRDVYVKAIKTAARHGIKDLSNYLLYNFKDKPIHLYERMKINIDLCEELGVTIYSFPMKYHPIDDPKWFDNRDYVAIDAGWNRKFIRAIQAVLNATKGKIGRGKSFFEEAFGKDGEEFEKILWMPETFIIYRRKYDANLRERLAERYGRTIDGESDLANEWWVKFNALPADKLATLKQLVAPGVFTDIGTLTDDAEILDVLKYYTISREERHNG